MLPAILRAGLGCAALLTFSAGGLAGEPPRSTAVDGWDYAMSGSELAGLCARTLTTARQEFAAIEQDASPATLATVFGAYDRMGKTLLAISHVWYMKSVHPDADYRAAASQCVQDFTDFVDSHNLSPAFHRRVAAIDLATATPAERLMVENHLRDQRQAGVDRDQATRERVRALQREITELGNRYEKNIAEDTRHVTASSAQLAGLPADYLAKHPADENGQVRISTDYPDYFPVMKYGEDDDLRRRLFVARQNIATPDNAAVLEALLARRFELAQLLDYDSYAALAMDGLMIASPANAQRFLDEVGSAAKAPAARDTDLLLQRLRRTVPDAEVVQAWQSSYLGNLVRQEQYALDAREVREYFAFERVQAGIFQLTEDLFGVEIVPWETATWHPDVSAWEIREDGRVLGRFYLDMHPRADKFKHAAHWTLRPGLRGGQVPLSGMATNFPRGLMEHNQVETFLHEFGHLLHNMFSGTQEWLGITGMSMQRDFVEAPSQMLEEWVWDYDTLSRFARNNAGEVIPRELVEKMNRARYLGLAMDTAQQIFYAQLSLNVYNRDPATFDLLPLTREIQQRYAPFPYVADTHLYNSFGHLNGYSSNYYIYQWSLAIATDLFSRFDQAGLRNRALAERYRHQVLGAAGSKTADEFVADFLGRPFSTEAYIELLDSLN